MFLASQMALYDLILTFVVSNHQVLYGSETPFYSILMINTLSQKSTKDKIPIKWMFQGTLDHYRTGGLVREDSNTSIKPGEGKRVMLFDIISFKYSLHQQYLGVEIDNLPIPVDHRRLLKKVLENHTTVREAVGFKDNKHAVWNKKVSLVWQQPIVDTPSIMVFDLIESACFGTGHDSTIKQALKLGKSAEETVRYGKLGVSFQAIFDAIESTRAPVKPEASEQTTATGGSNENNKEGNNNDGDMSDDGFDEDDVIEAKSRWLTVVRRKVSQRTFFIVVPKSEMRLLEMIKEAIVYFGGELPEGKNNIIWWNCKVEGEAKTQANLRHPTHRLSHMQKLIKAMLKADTTVDADANPDAVEIGMQSVYLFLDGFKHGNATGFSNCFQIDDRKLDKAQSTYYLTYEEKSLQARKQKYYSDVPMYTVELMTQVTQKELRLPNKNRLSCENQTNQNNHWGPIVTANPDTMWKLTFFDKKKYWGDARMPPSGGVGSKAETVRRQDGDMEPVAYHSNSFLMHKDVFHCWNGERAFDLTGSDDEFGMAAIAMGKQYICFCHTDFQAEQMQERLVQRTFAALLDPKMEGIYEPTAVADMAQAEQEEAEAKNDENKGAPRKPRKARKKPDNEQEPTPGPAAGTSTKRTRGGAAKGTGETGGEGSAAKAPKTAAQAALEDLLAKANAADPTDGSTGLTPSA